MPKFVNIILFLFLLLQQLFAQLTEIKKVEPPNWWKGIGNGELQLMLYGENIDSVNVSSESNYLIVDSVIEAENDDYLFVNLLIDENISPGFYEISIEKHGVKHSVNYEILKREFAPESHKGFWPGDAIYLITPDRFCNGNTQNDWYEGQVDKFPISDLNSRRGGDIEGIISKLDYIKDLGFTTIWITPVLENEMYMSYHGYAITDLYKVDPRFGNNELYKKLVNEAHKRGLKVILDHVTNHIGENHYWMKNLPFTDWINGTLDDHQSTNHNKMALFNSNFDPIVQKQSVEGWFTDYMPDLNLKNKFLSKYLIQNTIWWFEYAGIDGIREDTYPYADRNHMSLWAKTILEEYPNSNIVGEVWKGLPSIIAVNQMHQTLSDVQDTHLPSVTDFALMDAIREYLSGESSWNVIYETFSQDFLYPYPENLLVFMDNHDVTRSMYVAKENIDKIKLIMTLIATSRGIPQFYYGSEIGIVGYDHHGAIRAQFPGGFPGDERNAFNHVERTNTEKTLFAHLQKLLLLRKEFHSLAKGKFVHYPLYDDIYYYFKFGDKNKFLILINSSEEEKTISIDFINRKNSLININKVKPLLDGLIPVNGQINLKPLSSEIYIVN